jgi:hypothetical protein
MKTTPEGNARVWLLYVESCGALATVLQVLYIDRACSSNLDRPTNPTNQVMPFWLKLVFISVSKVPMVTGNASTTTIFPKRATTATEAALKSSQVKAASLRPQG